MSFLEISFLHPIFIYVVLPFLFFIFYFIFSGAKDGFKMFDEAVLKRLRFENRGLGRNTRNILFLLSFVLMVFALAQPVFKDGEIKVEAKSADILIGIDISDSMKAEDAYPNRLELAKSKAVDLIKQAPHNRMGVLAFAKHDYIVSPLSFDHGSVAFLLSKVQTSNITEKGTHLDSMINSAVSMLEHAKEKNLLLFTDGGDEEDFDSEIELAKEKGLRIFIIGVGSKEGSPVRSSEGGFVKHKGNILISRLNPALKDLATRTGGVYIESVLGEDDIKAMLKEIESITEKSTLKEETIPQYTQLFYYPLAVALFFLLLAFSSFPRGKANALILFGLLFVNIDEAKAGLLDFQTLQSAKEAYSKEEYKKSAQLYQGFAGESAEATYNYANSMYKDKEYEKALQAYAKVKTDEPDFKAKTLHNSANTQVQLKQYEEALKNYEASLELHEDKQTRENYEAVKKFLQEQKKEQSQDGNKDKDSDDKEKSDKDEKSKDQDSKDSESKDDKSENKDQQKSDQKNDKQDKDASDKSKEDEKKEQDQKEKESDASKEKKDELDKKEKEEASQKSQEKEKEKSEAASQEEVGKVPVTMKNMSDLEAKKWLKAIQQSQKGHLYKMKEAEHEEDENEKPW